MNEKRPINIIDVDRREKIKRENMKRLRKAKAKSRVTKIFLVLCIFALCIRILYYKVVRGEEYEKSAIIQQTTQDNERVITAKRGDVLDRNGKSLAISYSIYTVFVDVIVLNKVNESSENKDVIDKTAQKLNEIIGYPVEEFKAIFTKNSEGKLINYTYYYVIEKELSNALAMELKKANLAGIHLEENGKRTYPYNTLASQTLGFIGGDGKNSNWGLENYYNDVLTGIDGRYFVSYDENMSVRNFEIEATTGNSIMTTIDATMQQFTDEVADKYGIMHGAQNVGIIVMKPTSGEIIAISEYPRFNNNAPGNLSLVTDPEFLNKDEALEESQKGDHIYNLWKNFNISNTMEPGSIFKPVTVAMALEENIISHDDVFYCDGHKTYSDGTVVKCWIYNETGGGHGRQTVEEALANSCNVAMMEIAGKTTSSVFTKYQKDFGIGLSTGIDLPGEEDAKNLVYSADRLNEVEFANGSFGQGFKSTTMQNLIAFNATINGGYIVKPYIVSDIINSNGKIITHYEPEILRQVISKEVSDTIRNDLAATVTYGTGRNVAIDGYSIGGKTGTAEQIPYGTGKYVVSFVGYLPINNPEYVVIGVINEPNDYFTNHTSAVPMMREVLQKLITYYNIPTDSESLMGSNLINRVFMKDYSGDVVNAVSEINARGYNFEISGSGDTVYRQLPNVDQAVDENTTIILYVNSNENTNTNDLIEVPDLIGIDLDDSEEILRKLGFDVLKTRSTVVEATENKDKTEQDGEEEVTVSYTVVGQMPRKGVSLPKNTQIRLIYK